MIKHLQRGGETKILEMPEATKEILRELLAQNRMILEANCIAMERFGQPIMVIADTSDLAAAEFRPI